MALKWSRSIISRASGRFAVCINLAASWKKQRRLASPVNGSVVAARLWRISARSLAIASRMNAVEIVASSDSVLITVSHALANTCSAFGQASWAISGLRSRNTAPLANKMKIAGQRDSSRSARPRQNS